MHITWLRQNGQILSNVDANESFTKKPKRPFCLSSYSRVLRESLREQSCIKSHLSQLSCAGRSVPSASTDLFFQHKVLFMNKILAVRRKVDSCSCCCWFYACSRRCCCCCCSAGCGSESASPRRSGLRTQWQYRELAR
jgi:hypothetical protein